MELEWEDGDVAEGGRSLGGSRGVKDGNTTEVLASPARIPTSGALRSPCGGLRPSALSQASHRAQGVPFVGWC